MHHTGNTKGNNVMQISTTEASSIMHTIDYTMNNKNYLIACNNNLIRVSECDSVAYNLNCLSLSNVASDI